MFLISFGPRDLQYVFLQRSIRPCARLSRRFLQNFVDAALRVTAAPTHDRRIYALRIKTDYQSHQLRIRILRRATPYRCRRSEKLRCYGFFSSDRLLDTIQQRYGQTESGDLLYRYRSKYYLFVQNTRFLPIGGAIKDRLTIGRIQEYGRLISKNATEEIGRYLKGI